MKIILASEYFYPQSKGGTEMYVYQLVKEFMSMGHECLVLSISDEKQTEQYDGINIRYVNAEKGFYENENPSNLSYIINIVNEFKADVFHLHTLTPSIGSFHLSEIKKLGVKVFFTAHLPNLTCIRGDLMYQGTTVCDGFAEVNKCVNCYINSSYNNYLNKIFLKVLFKIKPLRRKINILNAFNRKESSLFRLQETVDQLIVVSNWQKDVLKRNNIDDNKIVVCRQAINSESLIDTKKFNFDDLLKVGFIGRIVKVKGLHLLIDVLKNIDKNKYILKIAGVKSENEIEYYEEMINSSKDLNVQWNNNLSSKEINAFLDDIDLLVVPSTWLETGPYVAFEALARKVPILAYNYGGIMELIENNHNGFLVENAFELKDVINKIISDKSILQNISNNITYRRETNSLSAEMIEIYNN